MPTRPITRSGGWVIVRLSQVPLKKRLVVADRLIRTQGLVGFEALEMKMAAAQPTHDPKVMVPVEDARKVLRG